METAPWQKEAVRRALQSMTMALGHAAGAGPQAVLEIRGHVVTIANAVPDPEVKRLGDAVVDRAEALFTGDRPEPESHYRQRLFIAMNDLKRVLGELVTPASIEVLLVEDNPLDAEFTMRALTTGGITSKLHWVKDGQEALDYLYREGAYATREDVPPSLVFLDLKMPRVNGLEVLKSIKFDIRTRNIPVVVMTSSAEDADVTRAYDLGANSYVVKPIELNSVIETVRKAGYYWLVTNRQQKG